MKVRVLLAGVLLVPVLVWAATGASGDAPPERFTACLSGGKLTAVATGDKPSVPCKSKQDEVSWVTTGPPGPQGAQGEPGPQGAVGADGPGRLPGEVLLDLAAGWPAQPLACGTVTKTFESMPAHGKVRIQATVGFVDDWQGETGYVSVGTPDHQDVVWTQSLDQTAAVGQFSVAGSPNFPDVVGQPLDVVASHAADDLTITIGTTLDCEATAALSVESLSLSVAP